MKIDLSNFNDQNYTCPECHWQGKGSELDIENFSEEHFIVDFECPKCGEHIGSGQSKMKGGDQPTEGPNEKIDLEP